MLDYQLLIIRDSITYLFHIHRKVIKLTLTLHFRCVSREAANKWKQKGKSFLSRWL